MDSPGKNYRHKRNKDEVEVKRMEMINIDNYDRKEYKCLDICGVRWYTPKKRAKQYYKRSYNAQLYKELTGLINAGYNSFDIANGSIITKMKMI